MRVSDTHRALVAKTDAFDEGVRTRRREDMKCAPGCSACCVADLTVCDVEAALLEEGIALLDHEALRRLQARTLVSESSPSCVFLEGDGRCAVYASRPLVCRTQGLPMRYGKNEITEAETFARNEANEPLTWCPLNFTLRAPLAPDVLDAGRLNLMIALSNRGAGGDAERRTSLVELAQNAVRHLSKV